MGVSVDHNVMRVGNIVKDSGEKYEFDDFDEVRAHHVQR